MVKLVAVINNIKRNAKKLKGVGVHNVLVAYSLFLVIKSTEFLKTFHKDSLNVILGVPARIFAIDCLSRTTAGVSAVSSIIKRKSMVNDVSDFMLVTHPKHLDLVTHKFSSSAHIVILGPVFVDTHSGKLLVPNLFGPNTKTVEVCLGYVYNSYMYSGIDFFLRKRLKIMNAKSGIYYSVQIREDQNYYHFLLSLAPAILRAFHFCIENEIKVIFLVPKLAPKFLLEFLETIPIEIQRVDKKTLDLKMQF